MDLKRAIMRRRRSEGGQTLLFCMIALVILLVGIVILFDLQATIRGKIKSQTAVDAAALVGANWQRHSLNLIGELNLVKACSVLITDSVFGIAGDTSSFMKAETTAEIPQALADTAQLESTGELLSQMQSRVSFVGPLIGLGAAQQAAKNNGLNYNEDWGWKAYDHYGRVASEDVYGDPLILSQEIQGYYWRLPYAGMLLDIAQFSGGSDGFVPKGFAVNPNKEFMGYPRLYTDPPTSPDFTSYLESKWIYEAINANYWCALRDLIRMDFGPKWWGNLMLDQDSASFPEESEYLPLHIDFFTGSSPYTIAEDSGALAAVAGQPERLGLLDPLRSTYVDDEDPYDEDGNPNPDDTDDRYAPLPRLTWAIYDSQWANYSEETKNTWSVYLKSSFKEGYDYQSGAVSYMEAQVYPTLLTGDWTKTVGSSSSSSSASYLGDAMSFGGSSTGGQRVNAYGQRLKTAEMQFKGATTGSPIKASALAKPYGRIQTTSGYLSPLAPSMILPVFERSDLIPVSLEKPSNVDPFDDFYYFLTEYLPVLGTVDSIDSMPALMMAMYPDHWGSMLTYHTALVKLNDPDWRAQGIAWLDAEATGHDVYDEFGMVTGHVVDTTNEDHCDYWPGGGSGPRSGPSTLH